MVSSGIISATSPCSDYSGNSRDLSYYKVHYFLLENDDTIDTGVSPGHERSLTQIKYNAEGDLLFSCSKDHIINVWFTYNGERLGTYDGHNGTVWTVDVDCASQISHSFTLPSYGTSDHQLPQDSWLPVQQIIHFDCGL